VPTAADVVVVGAGPAGLSTALHLVRALPAWRERLVVVDRAVHPRPKPCAGGVTELADGVLGPLDLGELPEHVAVRRVRLRFQDLEYAFYGSPALRVYDRSTFDAWLAERARERGVNLVEGCAVRSLRRDADGVEVVTSGGSIRARWVVVADGSNGPCRRLLGLREAAPVACLVERVVPVDQGRCEAFRERTATIDGTVMAAGLLGYSWSFPTRRHGAGWLNEGIYDSRTRPAGRAANLAHELRRVTPAVDDGARLVGSTLRPYRPDAPLVLDRVLLAGDAAGTDPLFGEGIAFALAFGRAAAAALAGAATRADGALADYPRLVRADPVLAHLRLRARLARPAYGPWRTGLRRFAWRLAGAAVGLTPWAERHHPEVAS